LLLLFDDTKGNHTLREYEEMKAHDVAWQLVEEWAKDAERPLTEQNIKNLNEVILVRPFWKEAITSDGQATRRQIKVGDYKAHPNSVRLPMVKYLNTLRLLKRLYRCRN
jgi:Fic family protein